MITNGNCVQIIKFLFCCTVPDRWNNTVIAPILKPGKDSHDPPSHRGISILSCVGKVFSAMIHGMGPFNFILYHSGGGGGGDH